MIFTFTWRVTPDGDFYEQDFGPGFKSRSHAARYWSRFWGLRQRDCHLFNVTSRKENT